MHIEELKQKLELCRTELSRKTGEMVTSLENSPTMLFIINALVAAIGSQKLRMAELESRLDATQHDTFPRGLESRPMRDEAIALQRVKDIAAAKARYALND